MLGAFLQFEVHLPLWLPESELDLEHVSRAFQHATELFVKSIGSLVPTLLVILVNSREISNWPRAAQKASVQSLVSNAFSLIYCGQR